MGLIQYGLKENGMVLITTNCVCVQIKIVNVYNLNNFLLHYC